MMIYFQFKCINNIKNGNSNKMIHKFLMKKNLIEIYNLSKNYKIKMIKLKVGQVSLKKWGNKKINFIQNVNKFSYKKKKSVKNTQKKLLN